MTDQIERDESMNRDYIPLPGGWEVQTKGDGSTLRILDRMKGERFGIPVPLHIVDFIERMAREVHAAAAADAADAARYRWLRAQHWDAPDIFVIAGGNKRVHLGTYCPAGEQLDEAIDATMSKETK